MPTPETVPRDEFVELTRLVTRALWKVIKGFDIKETLRLASASDERLSDLLHEALTSLNESVQGKSVEESTVLLVPSPSIVPAEGVEFKLTLDVTDPMEMVRSDGNDPGERKFTGSLLIPQTGRFKLKRVGYCDDLKEVRKKLEEYGTVPEGQWREAFKKAFPQDDGQGPIGFADPSWWDSNGRPVYPVLNSNLKEEGGAWELDFDRADCNRGGHWRWLVAILSP